MNIVKSFRKYLGNKIYDTNTNYILSLSIRGLLNIWQSLKIISIVLFSTDRHPFAKTKYIIPNNSSTVYINMPKGGCSSIRKALIKCDTESNQNEIIKDNKNVHAITKKYEYYDTEKIPPGAFVFTFVRNPFERLVSLYLNKFRSTATLDKGGFIYDYYLGGILTIGMSFEEFIKTIVRIPDRISERHFKSQYSIIYSKGVHIDYIGKFEELADGFEYVKSKVLNIDELPHFNKTENSYDYRVFYTLELVKLTAKRYRKDIEEFDYNYKESELLDFAKSQQAIIDDD